MKLRNRWSYRGGDRWDWEAFLDDEGSGELADVDFVEYLLHPTFPKPLVRVTEPEDGFTLRTNGWGTFELSAFVHHKDGTIDKLTHNLKLSRDPPEGIS